MRPALPNDGMLKLKIHPNARKTAWKKQQDDGTWKIDIAATAEDGKANAELIRFLAKEFGVPKANVEIVGGKTAARKRMRIRE